MEYTRIIGELSNIRGVVALALGGSRSSGTASEGSDHDVGLYYDPARLDVSGLDAAMARLDDSRRRGLLNPPGAWGPWINGGGWLTVAGEPVDLLLRDVPRVAAVLDACVRGEITIDYQCGHPFGFINAIYAAETHYALPLWQNGAAPLDDLKQRLGGYPPRMKAALIQRFMWEAGFSVECTRAAARKGDTNYVMGSAFRSACSWAQALHALNEVHWMNEKGAMRRIDGFALAPTGVCARIGQIYAQIAQGEAESALASLDALHAEMCALTEAFDVADSSVHAHEGAD